MGLLDGLNADRLTNAFLDTMDNDRGNDLGAYRKIAELAGTMSHAEILDAYQAAHEKAHRANSQKNDFEDHPYKNVESAGSLYALNGALSTIA